MEITDNLGTWYDDTPTTEMLKKVDKNIDILNINDKNGNSVIKVSTNGDVFVKGNLITNDESIVRYMKVYSKSIYKEDVQELLEKDPTLLQEIITNLRKNKLLKLKNK